MKRTLPAAVLFALALAAGPLRAQDELPGTQTVITVAVPTGGFSCGRVSYPEYCYGVPVNVGGTFWMDVYYADPSHLNNTASGFIAFNNALDLGQTSVTAATLTTNALGQIATMHLTFTGITNDGDAGTYTGTADFTFTYVFHRGGGGRGNPSFYVQLMKTGTLKITYN